MEIFGEYDVVIVGGGTSGTSAAIASARTGAKTILIERFGVLGGQMNVSGPPGFSYAHLWNNRGEQCLAGIIEETHRRLEKEGHALPYPKPEERNSGTFALVDPDWWGLLIFQMMTENGVNLLLHSLAVDVLKEGNGVTGVIVENTSGRQAVLGKVIIDCSGEGDIAVRAGAPFEKATKEEVELEPPSIAFSMDGVDWDKVVKYVREHAGQWGTIMRGGRKSLTPQDEAQIQMAIDGVKKTNSVNDLLKLGCILMDDITEEVIAKGEQHKFGDLGFFVTPRQGGKLQAIFQHSAQVFQCDATDVRELTAGEIEARRQAVISANAAKKYLPGFENAYLTRVTSYLRIRETRRIMGDHKLILKDVQRAAKFKNVVGKSVFPFAARHAADYTRSVYLIPEYRDIADGGSWDIPYPCLVPKEVENMLIAGKMVSAERNCYMRMLPETMITGQAAGAAAGICAKRGITPRKLEKDVSELQDTLVKQGAILFGTH